MKVPLQFASVVGLIISACMSTGINGSSADPELQEIAGYKQWRRLTETPLVVSQYVSGG